MNTTTTTAAYPPDGTLIALPLPGVAEAYNTFANITRDLVSLHVQLVATETSVASALKQADNVLAQHLTRIAEGGCKAWKVGLDISNDISRTYANYAWLAADIVVIKAKLATTRKAWEAAKAALVAATGQSALLDALTTEEPDYAQGDVE